MTVATLLSYSTTVACYSSRGQGTTHCVWHATHRTLGLALVYCTTVYCSMLQYPVVLVVQRSGTTWMTRQIHWSVLSYMKTKGTRWLPWSNALASHANSMASTVHRYTMV